MDGWMDECCYMANHKNSFIIMIFLLAKRKLFLMYVYGIVFIVLISFILYLLINYGN